VAAALAVSAGSRSDVLAVGADVARFEPIEQDDLRVVRVAADPGVDTVPAADLNAIVGRMAASELRPGVLLSEDHLVPAGQRLLGDGEAIVGARLAPGDAPSRGLVRGAAVLVVVRPPLGQAGEPRAVEGWLMGIGEADATSGERSASLVVPQTEADLVATAAGEQRVSIVALEE
jgi:hypothetical protein